MAEKEDLLKTERDGVTADDDLLKYCQSIYSESDERLEKLRPINVENLEFYEGIDPNLEARASDPRVKRASLFVHQLTPAIDSRIGEGVSKLKERERVVRLMPAMDDPTPQDRDLVAELETKLNDQLRKSGYISDVFEEHAKSCEINETPSVVLVGWKSIQKNVPSVVAPEATDDPMADPQEPRVVFDREVSGEPFVEYIMPDEFLYEPNISLFEQDASYFGRRIWKHKREIISLAKQNKWDVKAAKKYFADEEAEAGTGPATRDAIVEEVDRDRGTAQDKGKRDDKTLLVEWWLKQYDDNGMEFTNHVVIIGNKTIIHEEKDQFKMFCFPFVAMEANRRVGTIENNPTVSRGKSMQRLVNELINAYLDGLTYRIFPPFKKQKDNQFDGTPVYGPAEIWNLDEPDGLIPVIENPGSMPDIPAFLEYIASKMREIFHAPDVSQGFNSNEYEKATATRVRVLGAAKRSVPTMDKYGRAIKRIAEMFIGMNIQFNDTEAWKWAIPMNVDVPSLTNVTDPEQEKQDALLLYQAMLQDPQFATPQGKRKLRNAWEDLVRLWKRDSENRYYLSEEEFEQDIKDMAELAALAAEKQSLANVAAMTAAPPPQTGAQ